MIKVAGGVERCVEWPDSRIQSNSPSSINTRRNSTRSSEFNCNNQAVGRPRALIPPEIAPRMEQPHHFVGVGIETGEVGALVQITMMAGPREVLKIVRAPMLSRDDMLDVESVIAVMLLAQTAVFTPVVRPLPDALPKLQIHQEADGCLR